MKSLLLDIGSTSIKWAVYDREKRLKSEAASVPFPMPVENRPPIHEVSVEDIVRPVMDALQRYAATVDRLYISTQMHGYLLGDGSGGLLTPYISWQDRRSTLSANGRSCLAQLPVRLPPASGSCVKPNSPLCGLFAMKLLEPELFSRARRFYTLGSYIAYRLTGANATHITDAAASGMYNKEDGSPQFNPYPELELPEATMKVLPIGAWGPVAVYSPVGDHQASVLGSGLQDEREYLLNLGTAAQLCVIAEAHAAGEFESRPYFAGRTLCTVSGLPGGREMAVRSGTAGLADEMVSDYEAALIKLPARARLLVTGGAARHHEALVAAVCDRLGVPYRLRPDRDALDGLIELSDLTG
ncbi:FGGY family carbohydrate kinase [Cohnella hashimotonis]|uniref:FGGY family carbohydrate kinase n=1 Tax=Cohnella hashimotonis TaxID=2826895 RepID=A0ABT6TN66_9BACL|nr:FGGY family carbohydrate kinase [Cohnella hashimotonis]MDI4647986.1 FGGY family carbohydrate kinase [Cohnella hashimotonis]